MSMDAWVALDRKASDLAIQAMFPANEPRAARTRYREARSAWRGRGGDTTAWATQYASLRVALPQVPFDELGVVAFSNYVLGFGFVRSDLTLQGATSLAEALRDVDPGRVEVRAAPVVVERSRGGEVWHADASRVEPLRQSLAMGMRPPETEKLVTTRVRAARVLVVAPLSRARAARYADEVRRRLARSAGGAIDVTLVAGADDRLAFRAARELDRRPALAVLVAPAASGDAAAAAVTKVCAMLRNRRQEAVVSGPLPAGTSGTGSERDALESRRRATAACRSPGCRPAAGERRRRGRRPPSSRGRRAGQRPDARPRVLAGRARAGPRFHAPRLRLRRRPTHRCGRPRRVGRRRRRPCSRACGCGASPARASRSEDGGWQPPLTGRAIFYRPGSHRAAAALAGDLGLPARSVVRADDSPRKVVISTGD